MKRENYNVLKMVTALIVLCIINLSCSKNEEKNNIIFNYASPEFEVAFRTEGTIPTPQIDWPNNPGNFALKNFVQGVTLNKTTGEITIDRSLALGEQEIMLLQITIHGKPVLFLKTH